MSDKDTKEFNSFCKFFTLRVAQIVVQSRLGKKFQTVSSVQSQDWFNLKLTPLPDVVTQVKKSLGHAYPPEVPSICIDILLKTADGGHCLCMETWHVNFDRKNIVMGTSIANYVYHQMSVLIRSVLCASRNTPCYKYYANRQSADSFILMYMVQKSKPELEILGPDCKGVRLGAVGSSFGTISVTLHYRVNMVINPNDSGVLEDMPSMIACKYNLMPASPSRSPVAAGISIPRRRTSTICGGTDSASYDPAPWRGSAPDLGGLAHAPHIPQESPDFGYSACFSTSPPGNDQPQFFLPQGSPHHGMYPGSLGPRSASNPRIRPSSRGGFSGSSTSSESGSYSSHLQRYKHDSGSGHSKPDSAMFGMELSEPNSPRIPPEPSTSRQVTPRKYSQSSEVSLTPPAPPRGLPQRSASVLAAALDESDRPCSLPFASLLPGRPPSEPKDEERPNSLPTTLSRQSRTDSRQIPHVIFSEPSPILTVPQPADGLTKNENSSSSADSDDGFVKVAGYSPSTSRPPFARAQSGSLTAELGSFVRDCRGAPPVLKSFSVEGMPAVKHHRHSAPAGGATDFAQISAQLQQFTAQRVTFDEFVANFDRAVEEENA